LQMDSAKFLSRVALFGFLGIAVFFLWTEHRAHLLGALPYVLLLACPLMHLLHGGHHHRRSTPPPSTREGAEGRSVAKGDVDEP
jgi:hypothetical protein